MHYLDKEESKVNICDALREKGWKIYGYKEDQSDSMRDYFDPPGWDGVATKNGYILCVDVNNKYTINSFPDLNLQKNPGRCNWHVQRDGVIIEKGIGAFQFYNMPSGYNIAKDEFIVRKWADGKIKTLTTEQQRAVDKFKKFINKIDDVANKGQDTEYKKVVTTKTVTVTKPVPVERKELQNGDILTFSYQGGYWLVTDITENRQGIEFIYYESLGSPKRGYQRIRSAKRYYQRADKINHDIRAGAVTIHTMQEVTETKEVESWVNVGEQQQEKPTKKVSGNNDKIKVDYVITEDVDTRDNSPLWIVKLADKLNREEYLKVAEQFRAIGGYYSRFKGGFIFKEDPTGLLTA